MAMAATSTQTHTVFSLEQVAKHNQPDDAWIVIRGEVFDVSNYFDEHPGGRSVLTEVAGSDATEDFEYLDHSDYAVRMMKTFQVGVLSGADKARSLAFDKSAIKQAKGALRKRVTTRPKNWKLYIGVLSLSSLAMMVVQSDALRRYVVRAGQTSTKNLSGFWAGSAIAMSATVLGLLIVFQRLKRAVFGHRKGVFEYTPYYAHSLTWFSDQ